jgi:hypothetical protein
VNAPAQATSQAWSLSDARLYCDLATLDTGLQSNYAAHLSSGKSLSLAYSSFVTQTQRAEGTSQTLVLARSFTRLKGVFCTWFRTNDLTGTKNHINSMWGPHQDAAYNPAQDTLEVQCQIGSRKYPETAINSLAEFYYRLRLSIGSHFGDCGISILPPAFRSHQFILGIDFEKAATGPAGGVAFSGISTRGGELLTLDYKGFGVTNGAQSTTPIQSFLTCNYDAIMELSQDNVSVSD